MDGLIEALERLSMRALKSMPLLMGLAQSSNETQANREWEVYAAGIKSIQHPCETLLSKQFRLALECQGIQADVAFQFGELRAAELLRDAQVLALQTETAIAQYNAGYIGQDEAAMNVVGHKADAPAPRAVIESQPSMHIGGSVVQTNPEPQPQGEEGRALAALRRMRELNAGMRVAKIIPDGADEPLPPLPQTVEVDERDLQAGLDMWDRVLPDTAGLLSGGVQARRAAPNADDWAWDPDAHAWRNNRTGRLLSAAAMIALRDRFADGAGEEGRALAGQLATGKTSLPQWLLAMRDLIAAAYSAQWLFGAGGINAVAPAAAAGEPPADWQAQLSQLLSAQYGYLQQYAAQIAAGNFSPLALGSRSSLYLQSAVSAYEAARATSRGVPELPVYPGDGTSACGANCRCWWRIEDAPATDAVAPSGWNCYWELDPAAQHCNDCPAFHDEWYPLQVPRNAFDIPLAPRFAPYVNALREFGGLRGMRLPTQRPGGADVNGEDFGPEHEGYVPEPPNSPQETAGVMPDREFGSWRPVRPQTETPDPQVAGNQNVDIDPRHAHGLEAQLKRQHHGIAGSNGNHNGHKNPA